MWICGYQAQLIDSAGIRETQHEIEKEGILRSRDAMEKAGIIIWVIDASKSLSKEEKDEIKALGEKEIIFVINKTDLSIENKIKEELRKLKKEAIEISVKENRGVEKVIKKIEENLVSLFKTIEIPDILLNERQEETGRDVYKELCCARDVWNRPEIAAPI